MYTEREQAQQAAAYIKQRVGSAGVSMPDTAIVLGSGLGFLTDRMELGVRIPYEEISGFPISTVESHAGELCIGELAGKAVFAFSGRFHYYEGYDFRTVTFYVRVLHCLGVRTLILTNAAGGMNPDFKPGDLMLISDHIKLCADSPERGTADPFFGPRFFDMTETYTPRLRQLVKETASTLSLPIHEGVYCFMGGPQFETPAEIRALRLLGGDAVGMSTVPEAIVAARCGMQILGISCITNMAAGMIAGTHISDEEVTEVAGNASGRFSALVCAVLERMGNRSAV
ncbi:MAG: purine-nucleoside phosphorylase [Clostridia bacterium]|nr:purine-nucleoside phosphorylase [Clostridia bacterium]